MKKLQPIAVEEIMHDNGNARNPSLASAPVSIVVQLMKYKRTLEN